MKLGGQAVGAQALTRVPLLQSVFAAFCNQQLNTTTTLLPVLATSGVSLPSRALWHVA